MNTDSALIKCTILPSAIAKRLLATARANGRAWSWGWTNTPAGGARVTVHPVRIDATYSPAYGYQIYITPADDVTVRKNQHRIGYVFYASGPYGHGTISAGCCAECRRKASKNS
jgi:hypothetical protein